MIKKSDIVFKKVNKRNFDLQTYLGILAASGYHIQSVTAVVPTEMARFKIRTDEKIVISYTGRKPEKVSVENHHVCVMMPRENCFIAVQSLADQVKVWTANTISEN